jgi:hypothetical protein
MGAVGFEPTKALANGFTARPLWPLGHTPNGNSPADRFNMVPDNWHEIMAALPEAVKRALF